MSLAIEKVLAPATRHPAPSIGDLAEQKLDVAVVFTSVEPTLAALSEAGKLANSLKARIKLLVPQIVPYQLPLETPPTLVEFEENRFRVLARQSPVETSVQIYLCRDAFDTLAAVLKPRSLVVLGGPKKWWPTREKSLARKLRRIGHEVVFKETE